MHFLRLTEVLNEPIFQFKYIRFQERGQCKDAHQMCVASQVATEDLTGSTGDICETRKKKVQDKHMLG